MLTMKLTNVVPLKQGGKTLEEVYGSKFDSNIFFSVKLTLMSRDEWAIKLHLCFKTALKTNMM